MARICAPAIQAEMADWVALGGTNLGCCGDRNHTSGFHLPGAEVPTTDYSRRHDPGRPYDMEWCCAGDYAHNGNPALRARHAALLARLMRDDPTLWMVTEFIGQPVAGQPVLYWARWNGPGTIRNYTGAGHDRWSHISLTRSMAYARPYLWTGRPVTMTQFGVDIARYQTGLDLAKVKAAGFSWVNIKTTQGTSYRFEDAPGWADRARALGLGICTFHWLDNSASGPVQADRAWRIIQDMGGPEGFAHQVDCEDSNKPATYAILRDYVNAMQDKLGRPVVIYTGDWWWQATGRNWNAAGLTPYLWAAPNAGYPGYYPGDKASHWRAGYGGWGDYSVIQYAVQPITGAGGIDVSKSAIRDPAVWAALTGGGVDPLMGATEDVRALWAALFEKDGAGTNVGKGNVPEEFRTLHDDGGNAIGSQLNYLVAQVQALAARAGTGGLSAEDIARIADAVSERLVDDPATPTGPADRDTIRAAVEDVVGRLELTVTPGP